MQLCVSSAQNVSISLKIVSYRVVNYRGEMLAAFVRMGLSFAILQLVLSWVYFCCSFDETQSYQYSCSQSVLQFLGEPWIHFCNGYCEVYLFF